jgi:hypothetical protein
LLDFAWLGKAAGAAYLRHWLAAETCSHNRQTRALTACTLQAMHRPVWIQPARDATRRTAHWRLPVSHRRCSAYIYKQPLSVVHAPATSPVVSSSSTLSPSPPWSGLLLIRPHMSASSAGTPTPGPPSTSRLSGLQRQQYHTVCNSTTYKVK